MSLWIAEIVCRVAQAPTDETHDDEYKRQHLENNHYTRLMTEVGEFIKNLPAQGFVRWTNVHVYFTGEPTS